MFAQHNVKRENVFTADQHCCYSLRYVVAGMVNLFTPFCKTLLISFNSSSNTNIHVGITFCVPIAKSVLTYKKQ